MSTINLDNKHDETLQPAFGLWRQYMPENATHGFKAKTKDQALKWQAETRQALAKTIGFSDRDDSALNPTLIERVDRGDYVREKLVIQTAENVSMPFYLLLPKTAMESTHKFSMESTHKFSMESTHKFNMESTHKFNKRPLPVVLAFHGHGYGVKDVVGLWEDGEERSTPEGYHQDFAVALCKAGFAVAAPEISCFGERQTDFSYLNTSIGQEEPTSCAHAAMLAFHLGGSVVGMRVRDGARLVDYLETRPELDTQRLGAMGISGGGIHTFFSTCLDERIKACVISGYYSTFQDSILAMSHCACNFVPGLGQFGEMYDLAGMIAPRPFLVESGNYDPIFPRRAVERSVARAEAVYGVFNAQGQIRTDYFEGRHQISGRKAYDFLQKSLA